jgi:hypothetical protein
MSKFNVTNIKDLPSLEQILPGDFLIVENFSGTNKLDFDDFVVGPGNTSFANQLFNDVFSVSSYSVGVSSTASSQISSLRTDLNVVSSLGEKNKTDLSVISAVIRDEIIVRRGQFSLPANNSTTFFQLNVPDGVTLYNSDIHIQKIPILIDDFYTPGLFSANDYIVYSLSGLQVLAGSNTRTVNVFVSSTRTSNQNTQYSFTAMIHPPGDKTG